MAPWTVDDPGDGTVGMGEGFGVISKATGVYVAECANEDDARLIAVAPDLLAALRKIVHDWDGEPEDIAEAQAAITRATRGDPR